MHFDLQDRLIIDMERIEENRMREMIELSSVSIIMCFNNLLHSHLLSLLQ